MTLLAELFAKRSARGGQDPRALRSARSSLRGRRSNFQMTAERLDVAAQSFPQDAGLVP